MSPSQPRMNAALIGRPGGEFHVIELARPQPGPGEVLVRIRASGVNPLDLKIQSGSAPHARHPLPAVLGLDMAGSVEAVAPDVDDFSVGDEVYGMVGGVGGVQGTLAQYASVDARLLAKKPASLSMAEAACLPLVAITAWEGLVDRMNVQAGGSLLVHGGAGGVGHITVQLGRALGARVFATGRPEHADVIAAAGATPIDAATMTVPDYVEGHTKGRGFDYIFDTVGDEALSASFDAVGQYGHVVSALGRGVHHLAPLSLKGASYSGIFTLYPLLSGTGRDHHGSILRKIAELVDAGDVSPRVDDRRFGLETVADAHRALADRAGGGRIVVLVN